MTVAQDETAAEDEREVPIGTFELRSPRPLQSYTGLPPIGPVEPNEAAPFAGSRLPDDVAQALFSDAMAELEAGRPGHAQRLFEQMIARAPDSPLAGQARAHLADLYRLPAGGAAPDRASDVGPGPAASSGGELYRSQSDPGDGQMRSPPNESQDMGARVSTGLEEEFIAEAGDRVFFSAGSAELGSRARAVLASQAHFIKRRSDLHATIEGHADDAPLSLEQNTALSEARAEAVRQRLIAEGIGAERVGIVARGREDRVSECPDAACAAQNRRAVTVLYFTRARLGYGPFGAPPAGVPMAADAPAIATH